MSFNIFRTHDLVVRAGVLLIDLTCFGVDGAMTLKKNSHKLTLVVPQ